MKKKQLAGLIFIFICLGTLIPGVFFLIQSPVDVQIVLTDGYNSDIRLQRQPNLSFQRDFLSQGNIIRINSDQTYQTFEGCGAAITDASAWLLYHELRNQNATQYEKTMDKLFDRDRGIALSYLRLPMGASDCARTWYTYDDTAPDLSDFSIAHDEAYIIPLLHDALLRNPKIQILATPFSAPGWMKLGNNLTDPTTLGLIGGTLNPIYYDLYADYYIQFIQAYATHNITIQAVTIQNEPYHEPPDYPGMLMNETAQTEFIKILGARFKTYNLSTQIILHDHNWDLETNVLEILADDSVRQYISGVAWHGYSWPDPAAQSRVHEAYPTIDQFFTEITGFRAAPHFPDNLAWLYKNIFTGSINNWAKTIILWNLALDPTGGPILRPYYDMRGVITINITEPDTRMVQYEVEYYALGHIAKFLDPGAFRIGSDVDGTDLCAVAFRNPDSSIIVTACNTGTTSLKFQLYWNWRTLTYILPAKSVVTFIWENR
jgi:glucosylceramidase